MRAWALMGPRRQQILFVIADTQREYDGIRIRHRLKKNKSAGCYLTSPGFRLERGAPWCKHVILLKKKNLGAGIVAHEIMHLVLRLYRKQLRKVARDMDKDRSPTEEILCTWMQLLTKEFWRQYYAGQRHIRNR